LISTPTIRLAPTSFGALDDIEADPAEAEHDHVRARLDLRVLTTAPTPGGDTAADVAAGLERRVLADLCDLQSRAAR
jgi:hypothetical protein